MEDKRFQLHSSVNLILLKENKVLLQRRFNTGWMDGKYSFVAGHLDGNESVTKAMMREAFEEINLVFKEKDLIPATVIHIKWEEEYIEFFFVVTKWEGEPINKEPDQCDDLDWFPIDKLPDNSLPFVKQALENYKNKISFSNMGWN